MTSEEIKDAVLRLIDIYPPLHVEWEFNKILESVKDIFQIEDADYKENLILALNELESTQCVTVRIDQFVDGVKGRYVLLQRQNIYKITPIGVTKSSQIKTSIVLNSILETKFKDPLFLDMIIQEMSPYDTKNVNREIKKVLENLSKETKLRIYDEFSGHRFMSFLRKYGFVKTIGDNVYKFNKRGRKLVVAGRINAFMAQEYIEENKERERQELSDRLLRSSLDATTIQNRLLVANRWIAVAGIVAALYYFLEIQMEVKKQKGLTNELDSPTC